MNFKEEYKLGLDKISFDEHFNEKTMELIREKTPGKTVHNRKSLWTIIAVAAVIALFSITAFAAKNSIMLLPDKAAERVAEHFGFSTIEELFNSNAVLAINETVIDGEYRITLNGIAEGEKLARIKGTGAKKDETYAVLSVERLDGAEIDLSKNNIQFTPLVKGYTPYMIGIAVNCSLSRFVQDGIMYCLFDTQNLEIFADSTVYIAAFDCGIFINAFNNTADISYADSYDGVRAMFEIPLDPSNADSKAVKELLADFLK